MTAHTTPRRHDIDWLRVMAILVVYVFHSSRFFDTGDWHVKNPTTYLGVQVWTSFLANWLMPLIFALSGASLFFALGRRGAWPFVHDKVRRLLVPLVAGIFTHIILQVYLERVTHGQFAGSFWAFIPRYFQGLYPIGNFAWMGLHLWYLEVLFLYTLLCYPLLRWLRSDRAWPALARLGDALARPGVVYLLALPVAWYMAATRPGGILTMRAFGGWPLPVYLLFFLYGFIVISHEGLQRRIQQMRWVSLGAGALCIAALVALQAGQGDPAFGTARYAQVFGLYGLSAWFWVLGFMGLAFRYLTRPSPLLAYANEAVLPFYILHQTVLLGIGYYVTRWPLPDLARFLVIVLTAFASIMLLYEFGIRRANALRFLFGMKPKARRRIALHPQGETK